MPTNDKQTLAIDGISAAPMRTIGMRTTRGLQITPRARPAFQSRRDRHKLLQPQPIKKANTLPKVLSVKVLRSYSKRSWLFAMAMLASAVASIAFVQIGLVIISAGLIFELFTKRKTRPFFLGAFLLSFSIPLFALFNMQETIIAKNSATYLFALFSASIIILIVNRGKSYYKKL